MRAGSPHSIRSCVNTPAASLVSEPISGVGLTLYRARRARLRDPAFSGYNRSIVAYRKVNTPTTNGFVALDLDDPERSIVSELEHAVRHYRETGDTRRIEGLAGMRISGFRGTRPVVVELETNPAELEVLFGAVVGDYEFYVDD